MLYFLLLLHIIFVTFQKEFPNICYDERSSIVGIGEPNKQLLCYFKKTVEGEILVKFKAIKSLWGAKKFS